MSWDYAWQLGPKGGTLVDLADYCQWVRFQDGAETIGNKRINNQITPYRHGTLAADHKFNSELIVPLEIAYRYTNAAGTVTDPNGAAGHMYANKTTVEGLLFGSKSLATLRRTTPDDTMDAYIEPLAPSTPTQNRLSYLYLLNVPSGFWRSTTLNTDSATPVAVGGNAPVSDAVIDIVGGTNVVVTMTADGATISISGATPASGVRVDLEAGTVTKISDSSDYHEFVSFNKPYRLVLEPGDNAFSTAGAPSSVTFKWYDKWR